MKSQNKQTTNKQTNACVIYVRTNYKKNMYLGDIAISYEITNERSKNSNFFKYNLSLAVAPLKNPLDKGGR